MLAFVVFGRLYSWPLGCAVLRRVRFLLVLRNLQWAGEQVVEDQCLSSLIRAGPKPCPSSLDLVVDQAYHVGDMRTRGRSA